MSRYGLLVLMLSVVAGYFGLGVVAGTPGSVAVTLVLVFVAALLVAMVYESVSRRRWLV